MILDADAVVGGAAWIKAASKLSDIYKASDLASVMTKAPTWTGVISQIPLVEKLPVVGKAIADGEKTVEVAPGMFRMIGASLKTAGDPAAEKAFSGIKDFEGYGVWRAVDIVNGQTTWTFSGVGIEAIPGNVRNWVNNAATGKAPWSEPAGAATG